MELTSQFAWTPYVRAALLLIILFMLAFGFLSGETQLIRIESATL
jgi:hypothetical protein